MRRPGVFCSMLETNPASGISRKSNLEDGHRSGRSLASPSLLAKMFLESSPVEALPEDALFQSAFEYASIGMALVAPNGAWLRVNHSVCQITGYTEAELLDRTFQDITHPDDLYLDLANVRKMLAGEIDTYQMEKRYFHKNGAIVWVLLSVSLVHNRSGAPLFFISQIQDITRRKQSDEQLAEATAEIQRLQRGLLKVCAWTKRIELNGKWIPIDEFLTEHLHLKLMPGTSVQGGRMFDDE